MTMYKEIGAVIRRLREQRGWSLSDLAGQLDYMRGADSSGLQRIERGTKRAPLDLYVAVAGAFGMPLSEMIVKAELERGTDTQAVAPEERELVQAYRLMQPSAQEHYLEIAKGLAKKEGD